MSFSGYVSYALGTRRVQARSLQWDLRCFRNVLLLAVLGGAGGNLWVTVA